MKFYQGLFGWQINAPPGMEYWLAHTVETDERGMPTTPGAINGGLFRRSKDAKTTVIVIKVQDIETAMRAIEAAGGKITQGTTQVGDFGLYARFLDSEGNLMGLWQDVVKK